MRGAGSTMGASIMIIRGELHGIGLLGHLYTSTCVHAHPLIDRRIGTRTGSMMLIARTEVRCAARDIDS